MSFPAIEAATRSRAAALQMAGLAKGDRLGLVVIDHQNFVLTFLAALRVGIIPVPLYPPVYLGNLASYLEHTAAILTSAMATVLCCSNEVKNILWSLVDKVPRLRKVIVAEELGSDSAPELPAITELADRPPGARLDRDRRDGRHHREHRRQQLPARRDRRGADRAGHRRPDPEGERRCPSRRWRELIQPAIHGTRTCSTRSWRTASSAPARRSCSCMATRRHPTSGATSCRRSPPHHRCLAPDLIGMGESGKPDLAYRYQDHARCLDAWFDALDLRDVVLVGYDWGGVLAIDWASRHPARVRGVVVFETILQGMRWADYPPQGAELFRTLRTPGAGDKLVLEDNGFLPVSLRVGVKSGLSDAARAAYYAPFPDPASRRPMLQWTRSLPIDGEPADVLAIVTRNAAWLAATPAVPKLLLTFDGTNLSNAPAVADWARALPGLAVVALGAAGHHAPEDAPDAIASTIRTWLAAHGDTGR